MGKLKQTGLVLFILLKSLKNVHNSNPSFFVNLASPIIIIIIIKTLKISRKGNEFLLKHSSLFNRLHDTTKINFIS
jgi:hypothetical protein